MNATTQAVTTKQAAIVESNSLPGKELEISPEARLLLDELSTPHASRQLATPYAQQRGIELMLDTLGSYRTRREELEQQRQSALDGLLTDEQRAAIEKIDEEFVQQTAKIDGMSNRLQRLIKAEALEHGSTVHGSTMMAVYSLRTSWDSKGLAGYGIAYPEVLTFRAQKASVSIRRKRS